MDTAFSHRRLFLKTMFNTNSGYQTR